jgi:hypothetical protein
MKAQAVINISNRSDADLILALEPWADEYPLSARATVRIVGFAEAVGEFEVGYSVGRVTVYAWPGATIRLFDGDQEFGVGNGPREPVPRTPAV